MINQKISLGVDISGDCISYAVVTQEKNCVKIISAGKTPTPSGVVKDGNITDPASLARALKSLIGSKRFRHCKSSVSLTVSPSLAQIIEMPEEIPSNVGNFVHSEIRHSAFLSGKDVQMDYCGLGLSAAVPARVFVSAVEKNKMKPLLRTLKLAGIEPETIEPPIAGWIRSIYQKHIKPKFNSSVVVVLVRDNVLNLCVFRKTAFDFIRRIDVSGLSAEECLTKCQTEINAVTQYYDIEFGSSDDIEWECLVELPNTEGHGDIQTRLSKAIGMNVHVCSPDSVLNDTSVESKVKDLSVTLTAVGLAFNQLKVPFSDVKTNLIPDEIKESRAAKRELLILANAVIGILLAIFAFAGFAAMQFNSTQQAVKERKAKSPLKNIESLVSRQKQVKETLTVLTETSKFVDQVLEKSVYIDWSSILELVRNSVPASLYITRMDTQGDFGLEIKGKALSPESVNLFSAHLDKSDLFASSSVKEIKKTRNKDGVIDYTVKCVIADNRRLYAEAN